MASDFLSTYTPLANDIATQTGVDPSVVLGIIDTETGGGAHVKGNNIFGISPSGPQGQYVAGYPDVETAAQAFVNLMQTPRYRGVAAAGDPASQAAALVKGGYNTANPNYAGIVANKAINFGQQLGYQDGQGGAQPAASPAPDYNTPAPSSAPQSGGGSAKQQAIDDLNQPATTPAQQGAPKPGSAKQQAIDDLDKGQPPDALTGPPATKPSSPDVPAQPDTSQGYFGPDGSYVPPAAMPSKQQAADASTPPAPMAVNINPNAGADILRAMKEGWEGSPSILTPAARQAVDQSGILGRYIYNPLMDIAGGGLAAGSALLRGGQQLAAEVAEPIGREIPVIGHPGLGRDVAALPEAFPTGDAGLPGKPPTPQAARNALARPVTVEDLTGAISRVPPDEPPGGAVSGAAPKSDGAAAPSEHATAAAGPEMADAEAPQPRSAGAASSREGTPSATIPEQTNVERARNLRTQIDESARDRAGPNLTDDTPYVTNVPGGTLPGRMAVERDFNPQNALDFKRRMADSEGQQFRAAYDANNTARNQGMVDLLRQDAGDGITLDQARQARREVSPDNFGAFRGEQPVNAQPVVDAIQGVLDGPEGKRGAVERTMQSVSSRLYDREGNLETAPSQLYGVRQHIDDLMNKAARPTDAEGTDAHVAQFALRRLADRVDSTIQSGAPRYQAYRDAYREMSQPVNQQRFLQRYQQGGSSVTDQRGNLQLTKLNKMLNDIHAGLTDSKNNLAKSLTDQQIQNIVNVRNEVAARDFAQQQAATRGSDSYQLFNRAAETGGSALGRVLKGTAELGAHSALGYMATHGLPEAGLANALMAYHRAYVRPARVAQAAAKARTRANALAAARDAELLSQRPVNPLGQY